MSKLLHLHNDLNFFYQLLLPHSLARLLVHSLATNQDRINEDTVDG